MSYLLFLVLIIIVSVLLILVIMVQNPKGGGLSSSFGGGGNQVVGGVKKTGDFLDRSTWTLAGLLIVLILLSNVAIKSNYGPGESRLLNGGSDTENVIPEETMDETLPPAEGEGTTDGEGQE